MQQISLQKENVHSLTSKQCHR